MKLESINSVYFLGIGGIGMSALARYFHLQGKTIGGYDLTSTPLTDNLEDLGMQIHFDDNPDHIPGLFLNKDQTLIVITPAIPDDHQELNFFLKNGYNVLKRAKVLGHIFNANKGIAIAGTHGKTSVSTFTAFLLQESGVGCSAFLGGISKNYNSNLVLSRSENVVAEADEFDRSFLQLYPNLLLITTIDVDHLDIYRDLDDINEAFSDLLNQVDKKGKVILNERVQIEIPKYLEKRTYSFNNPNTDYFAIDPEFIDGVCFFSLNTPKGKVTDLQIKVPGITNVENAIAALSVAIESGAQTDKLKEILPELKGVTRRFDLQYSSGNKVYIDDYAHHPRELDAVISSMRKLYPGKKLTVIFQPHLFSRTRDFANEFAESLSKADELILLDIYPAREEPIPGITSEIILNNVVLEKKQICSKVNLLHIVKELNIEVLLTAGAGDIDKFVNPIRQSLLADEED